MRMRFFRYIAVVLVALAASTCGGVVNPSNNQTDTLTGIIVPGGPPGTGTFTASKSGELTVTVTKMNPTYNGFVSVEWLGAGCGGLIQQNIGLVGQTVLSGPINQGSYCIAMLDPGFIVPEAYTITVSHP
jgi:hypothetical protein